jgi:hypothetical protein
MINPHTELDILSSNRSLVFAIKPKTRYRLHFAAILWLHIVLKITLNK